MEELKNRIEKIEKRNKIVEKDKAWETSWTRRICIMILKVWERKISGERE